MRKQSNVAQPLVQASLIGEAIDAGPVLVFVFDEDGGRVIYFEGTYVNTFSGNPEKTPGYDYNQIMYRLDLADPRLQL